MGRWTQYDEDEYRLPNGMKRIGYDADSGRYYYRGGDRSIWQGPVGAEFGEMTQVNALPSSVATEGSRSEPIDENDADDDEADDGRRGDDVEASPRTRSRGYQLLSEDHTRPVVPRTSTSNMGVHPYRTLFPFFLIIAVVLLLVWRLLLAPTLSAPPIKKCPEGTVSRWVQPGDSCWELSRENGWNMDKFKEANPKVVCDPLMPGTSVCLPPSKAKKERMGQQQQRRRL